MTHTLRNLLSSLLVSASLAANAAGAAAPVLDTPAGLVAERLDAALDSRGLSGPREVALDNPMLTLPKKARKVSQSCTKASTGTPSKKNDSR